MKSLFLGTVFLLPIIVKSQDIHFSQFNETPVILNPALCGVAYDTRVIVNYKDQWASVTSPYQTYGISIEKALKHLKLKKTYLAMSLNFFNDKAGDAGLGTMQANLGLNVIVKVSQFSKLSGGLGGGILYRTINASKLKWQSQYDGYNYNGATATGEVPPVGGLTQADFVGGINYHYAKSERYISAQDGTKFDIGFSAFHFNTPKYSFVSSGDKQFGKIIAHANFDIGIKGAGVGIVPSIIYMKQGPSQELNLGCMFKYIIQDQTVYTKERKPCAISLGAFYRVADAFIPSLLFQYDKFALGVSYDLNVSQLTAVSKSKGGLEVSLRFNTSPGYGRALGKSANRKTYR